MLEWTTTDHRDFVERRQKFLVARVERHGPNGWRAFLRLGRTMLTVQRFG